MDLGLVGSFSATTLPPPGKGPTQLSFIFSTCMMPFPFVPYRVFDHWRALEPDLAFILGDLVYNDASVEGVGSLLARVFSIPQLRALVQHVPLYFTWEYVLFPFLPSAGGCCGDRSWRPVLLCSC